MDETCADQEQRRDHGIGLVNTAGVTRDYSAAITNMGHKPFKILHKLSFFNLKKKKSKVFISESTPPVTENTVSPATPPGVNTSNAGNESTGPGTEYIPPLTESWGGTPGSDAGIRFSTPRFGRERHMSEDSSTSSLSTQSGNSYQRDSYQSLSSLSSNEVDATQDSTVIPPVPLRDPPPPPYSIEALDSSSQPSAPTEETQPTDAAPSTSTREAEFDVQSRYSFDETAPPDGSIVASLFSDLYTPPAAEPDPSWELEVLEQIRRIFPHSAQTEAHPINESNRQGKQSRHPLPGSYPRSPSSSVRRTSPLSRRYHGHPPRRTPTRSYAGQWERDITDAEIDGLGLIDPFHSERIARMEEEDRALAEELQRLEQEELEELQRHYEMQAEEISRMEEREEAMRLENLKRIAQEDELLAQTLMAQEQRDFDEEQRQRREKQEKEKKEKEKKAEAEAVKGIGAPVSVRQVNAWGAITEASRNELTPEIVKHLKHLVEVFRKNMPEQQIVKLEWIVNRRLEIQFENTREQLKKAKHSTKEILLFHGTENKNVNKYVSILVP